MEDITDADYTHTKRGFKGFEMRNLGKCPDPLLFADVFENFRNMCSKICKLDLAKFLSVP